MMMLMAMMMMMGVDGVAARTGAGACVPHVRRREWASRVPQGSARTPGRPATASELLAIKRLDDQKACRPAHLSLMPGPKRGS